MIQLDTPAADWIDLRAVFEEHAAHAEGLLAKDDSGDFYETGALRVDTGYEGTLNIPLCHHLEMGVWLSEEIGARSASVIRGEIRSWSGAGTWLGLQDIWIGPVSITVSEVSDEALAKTPLLGQAWFEHAQAVWIDPVAGLIAVSYRRAAVDAFIAHNPAAWVVLPWRPERAGGLRFVPAEIAGVAYEAVIDTGAECELFLDVMHPPMFVEKPWGRGRMTSPSGSSGFFGATSVEPLRLGTFDIDRPEIWWFGTPSETLVKAPDDKPFAILGMRFLERYPVLLDPKMNLAYFYTGGGDAVRPLLPAEPAQTGAE